VRSPLGECHQSDSDCLARRKFEFDEPQPSGPAAVIGTLAHEIIERYTYEQAQHPDVAPMSVVREVLAEHLKDPEVTGPVVDETVRIMAGAFDSDLRLGLPGSGWECVPEWRWAMSEGFTPIAPCENCGGTGMIGVFDNEGKPAYEALCSAYGNKPCFNGWSKEPAYAGTVDRLEFNRSTGEVRIYDWKSIILRESSEDIRTKRQPRWYSVAVLAHFPDVNLVTFYEVNLRHCYMAKAEFKRGESWEEQTKARMRAGRAARLHAIETDKCRRCGGTGVIHE